MKLTTAPQIAQERWQTRPGKLPRLTPEAAPDATPPTHESEEGRRRYLEVSAYDRSTLDGISEILRRLEDGTSALPGKTEFLADLPPLDDPEAGWRRA